MHNGHKLVSDRARQLYARMDAERAWVETSMHNLKQAVHAIRSDGEAIVAHPVQTLSQRLSRAEWIHERPISCVGAALGIGFLLSYALNPGPHSENSHDEPSFRPNREQNERSLRQNEEMSVLQAFKSELRTTMVGFLHELFAASRKQLQQVVGNRFRDQHDAKPSTDQV